MGEIRFKSKTIKDKEVFTTPCPLKRTTFYASRIKMVGEMGCMFCKDCEGIDWDNKICRCKGISAKPKKIIRKRGRKML